MYSIEMQEMTPEFLTCWKSAGLHLSNQVDGGIQSWLRAHPFPPFLEHLSFRLGNQLFFVRVEDVDGKVDGPGSLLGLLSVAKGCRGHACVLPMKKKFFGGTWVADNSGWGLLDAESRKPVNPVALVTDEDVEMTPWELQDMAVQVVRENLEKQGFQLMSWQGNPEVDPAIWFVGKSKKPEWVVVRAVRYPESQALRPENWDSITDGCAHMSRTGHFASVAVVNVTQPFKSENEAPVPLFRGHGMHVRFTGLE